MVTFGIGNFDVIKGGGSGGGITEDEARTIAGQVVTASLTSGAIKTALDTKANDSELQTVAKSGKYVDLTEKPVNVSEFVNDVNYAKMDEVTTALGNKVDKVAGKGLSTTDVTTEMKEHYEAAYTHSQAAHAPADAERNTIVGIKQDGTELTPDAERKVNITGGSVVGPEIAIVSCPASVTKDTQFTVKVKATKKDKDLAYYTVEETGGVTVVSKPDPVSGVEQDIVLKCGTVGDAVTIRIAITDVSGNIAADTKTVKVTEGTAYHYEIGYIKYDDPTTMVGFEKIVEGDFVPSEGLTYTYPSTPVYYGKPAIKYSDSVQDLTAIYDLGLPSSSILEDFNKTTETGLKVYAHKDVQPIYDIGFKFVF